MMTKSKRLQQRQEKPRANLARDLEILRQHLPASLRGEGKSVEEIADEEGVSKWAIYKALEREDVKEAERAWVAYIVGSQRDLGPVAVKALGRLLEAGDSATVNQFFKRMGPPEPVADVAIEKLTISGPPEYEELARRLNPGPDASESEGADGAYHCPVAGCSYTTTVLAQLGEHLQEAHCSGRPDATDEEQE